MYVIILPGEKVQRICSEDVPVPLWLGKIIEYFIVNVRSSLKPKKGVKSLWINSKSNLLGNID
jgi:hypothetical protein